MGALQRRVVEAHRQASGNFQLQHARRLLNQLERFGVSHSGLFMINRLVTMLRQVGIDLRTGAIDHHQTNSQAVKQANVIDYTREIIMLDGFPAQHDDKRFTPMGINIGDRMAESLYQFGATFLHHDTTSMHDYS